MPRMEVSIPSSSGHQFTEFQRESLLDTGSPCFNPFFIRASVYCGRSAAEPRPVLSRFNPFFIRASVYCGRSAAEPRPVLSRFNPFFIRASVYCQSAALQLGSHRGRFNPFFIRASVYWLEKFVRRSDPGRLFQSLLHQGISLLHAVGLASEKRGRHGFNPFFIRASVYCFAFASR